MARVPEFLDNPLINMEALLNKFQQKVLDAIEFEEGQFLFIEVPRQFQGNRHIASAFFTWMCNQYPRLKHNVNTEDGMPAEVVIERADPLSW